MRNVFVVLGISLVLGASGIAYAQSPVKIGYIDLQRVIDESQAGKSARASFKNEFKGKIDMIEQRASQLVREKQEFMSKAPVMDLSAKDAKAEEISRMEKELQRMREDVRDEIQKRDFEFSQKIQSELEVVIKQLGESGGYTLIIEKTQGGILYAGKGTDLTDEVIKAYDAKKTSSR
jgi:outer membrane protein